jgi:hypothetical protein
MLEILKRMEDYDMIFFTPHEENDDEIKIETALYKVRGEPIDIHCEGVHNSFDIVLFRYDEEEGIKDLERFQGVLTEPREYVSRMIKSDYFGFVARKTTTSAQVVQETFDNWSTI